MGNALKDLGNLNEAIDAYSKAISIKPDFVDAYNNLGLSFQNLGKLKDAITAYSRAISLRPAHADAWNNVFFSLRALKLQKLSYKELKSHYPKKSNSQYAQIATSLLNYKLTHGLESDTIALQETFGLLSLVNKNTKIQNPTTNINNSKIDVLQKK